MNRLAPLLIFLLVPAAIAQPTAIQALGDLPGFDFNSQAHDVSADGAVVVGRSLTLDEGIGVWHAFRWTEAGGMQDLGDLPNNRPDDSEALAVSADGTVVVGRGAPGDFFIEAFRWTEATGMQGLGTLPGGTPHSIAYGVSADGAVVVGQSSSANTSTNEAFRWENGMLAGLGFLPNGAGYSIANAASADGDVVVGYSHDGSRVAFRWEGGVMTSLGDLAGSAIDSWATAVTPDGSVVVGRGFTEFGFEPFRWTATDGMQPLRDPDGVLVGGEAFDVSADGSVVVGGSGVHAFVWTEADGMRRLRDVLIEDYGLDLTGWSLDIATGISDDGRVIVGTGFAPGSGGPQAWRVVLGAPVSAEAPVSPLRFALAAPHPNPFRARATLLLTLPEAQHVVAEVFDVLGRRVAVLHEGPLPVGTHRLGFEAGALPTGVYLVRAEGAAAHALRRVTVVR